MPVDQARDQVGGRRRRALRLPGDRVEEGLAELEGILSWDLPEGLPPGPRQLAVQLRDDDEFARRVWSHPVYIALVTWARNHYPDGHQAWEDMAVYALSRATLVQTAEMSARAVRSGMFGTASWIKFRGRELERLDRSEPSIESLDLIDERPVPADSVYCQVKPPNPIEYLSEALGSDLPVAAGDALDEAWDLAQEHYVWLAKLTGLTGQALLSAGQGHEQVSPRRRLGRRLPPNWPPTARRAVVHLLAGTPKNAGLLAWWAETPAADVPLAVCSRWRGLVTAVDDAICRAHGRMQLEQHRARPLVTADDDRGIAV